MYILHIDERVYATTYFVINSYHALCNVVIIISTYIILYIVILRFTDEDKNITFFYFVPFFFLKKL